MVKQFAGRLRDVLMQFAWLYGSNGSMSFRGTSQYTRFRVDRFYRSSDMI